MSGDEQEKDIIPNPFRDEKQKMARKPYIPEYLRLDVEPKVMDNPIPSLPKKSIKKQSVQEPKFPPPTKVFVGNNQNWFETAPVGNNSMTSPENILSEESLSDSNDKEEILEISSEEKEEEQAPLFSSLEENEFALVIKDQVITSSSNIEEIESYIDSILFDNVIPGLNMNHIKVFKRLSIKIGANIMEDYGRGKKSY